MIRCRYDGGSGFGHQRVLGSTLTKIRQARELIDRVNPRCDLEVDGGIDAGTAQRALEVGANVFVAGQAYSEIRVDRQRGRTLAEALEPQLQPLS